MAIVPPLLSALESVAKRLVMRASTRLGIEAFRIPPSPEGKYLASYPELALNLWLHGRVNAEVRIRAHDFVDEYLRDVLPEGVAEGPVPTRVWVYWDQGWSDAPAVVTACRKRLERFADGFEIVALERDNLRAFADIPDEVRRNTGQNRTAFSEALRFDLLARHGGVWLDATCWLTRPLGELRRFADGRMFAYRQPDGWTPAWLMVAPRDHVIPRTMRDLLIRWWSSTSEHPAYFWYIYLFEAAANRIPTFARAWSRSSSADGRAALAMNRLFDRQLDVELLEAIEGSTFVQKLSYKHAAAKRTPPGSFAARVLEGP